MTKDIFQCRFRRLKWTMTMTFLDLFRACLVSIIFGSKQVFDKFNQMSRYVWRGKKRSLNLDFDFMV